MARPQKQGLEYFPLDVDIDQDDKVYLIEAKHGIVGFALFIRLLMKIYKNGYYIKWGDNEAFILAKQTLVDVNVIKNVVNDCINYGLFNQKLYDEYGILTSSGIQKRYFEASARRKEVIAVKEFLLIDPSKYSNIVIVDINGVNVNKNEVIVDNMHAKNPQSKVKESKVKESKKESKVNKNKIKIDAVAADIYNNQLQQLYEIFANNIHPPTPLEIQKLQSWLEDIELDVIILAIEEAVKHNARNLAYIEKILRVWTGKGFKTREDVLAFLREQADKSSAGKNDDMEEIVRAFESAMKQREKIEEEAKQRLEKYKSMTPEERKRYLEEVKKVVYS